MAEINLVNRWYIACKSDSLSYICSSWEESPNSRLLHLVNAQVITEGNPKKIEICDKIHKSIWINSDSITFITEVVTDSNSMTMEAI